MLRGRDTDMDAHTWLWVGAVTFFIIMGVFIDYVLYCAVTFYGEEAPGADVSVVEAQLHTFGGTRNGRMEMQDCFIQMACSVRAGALHLGTLR